MSRPFFIHGPEPTATDLPLPVPFALSPLQAAQLVRFAGQPDFDLDVSGVHVGRFLEAYVRSSYDTGLRAADLFAATWLQLDHNGVLTVTPAKTGRPVRLHPLRPATLQALGAVRVADDDRLLPWPADDGSLTCYVHQLLAMADVTPVAVAAKGGAV